MARPPQPVAPQSAAGPVNALMWEPLGRAGRYSGPSCVFVVRSDGPTLHGVVCAVAQRLGTKIRHGADRYEPRARQVVAVKTRTALATLFDPTPGFSMPRGIIFTSWYARPDGLITVALTERSVGVHFGDVLPAVVFPRFALEMYDALVQAHILVWASTLVIGSSDDLARWPTAPGSPAPQAPYLVTKAGIAQARAAGWRRHLI